MGVVSRRQCVEFVVVRRYIDFLLLLISTLVSVFGRASLLFVNLNFVFLIIRIIMKN